MTFDDIKNNKEITTYIEQADKYLKAIGYTEHSFSHVGRCVKVVDYILGELGYDEHTKDLAKIAAYMHDIGNVINRDDHAKSGALMAFRLLDKAGMETQDIAQIISAIGNHDESSAYPVNIISSALIIADKTDVRRNRVRSNIQASFDIHDQVNYAVTNTELLIDTEKKVITLNLTVDEDICTMYEYFEIFLGRMMMCRRAAEMLGMKFKLRVNGSKVL